MPSNQGQPELRQLQAAFQNIPHGYSAPPTHSQRSLVGRCKDIPEESCECDWTLCTQVH